MATNVVVAETGDVAGLVELAIREKVPVEVLERLVALRERVAERDARAAFFQAVASFQEQCPEITKDKTAQITTKAGGKYSYTYAPLETITRTIRPVLHRNGLEFSWTTEQSDRDGVLNVVCILRHIEGHSERATFPVPTATDAAMSAAQKNGAALTYGRRQSLVAVLGLVTADEDNDAPETGSGPITPGQAAAILDKIVAKGADMARFCAYMGVEKVEEIRASDFERAIAALNRKGAR